MEALRDPLLRCILMAVWLMPCAIQDWRTRRVSNWLTVPLFMLAWPVAVVTGNLPLTLAVLLGTYMAWVAKAGLGAADGKVAVGLAAFAPQALLIGFLMQAMAFIVLRLRHVASTPIPGVIWFWAGTLIVAVASIAQSQVLR
jgi:Flp pilus assembly protein protease CpaA